MEGPPEKRRRIRGDLSAQLPHVVTRTLKVAGQPSSPRADGPRTVRPRPLHVSDKVGPLLAMKLRCCSSSHACVVHVHTSAASGLRMCSRQAAENEARGSLGLNRQPCMQVRILWEGAPEWEELDEGAFAEWAASLEGQDSRGRSSHKAQQAGARVLLSVESSCGPAAPQPCPSVSPSQCRFWQPPACCSCMHPERHPAATLGGAEACMHAQLGDALRPSLLPCDTRREPRLSTSACGAGDGCRARTQGAAHGGRVGQQRSRGAAPVRDRDCGGRGRAR